MERKKNAKKERKEGIKEKTSAFFFQNNFQLNYRDKSIFMGYV